MAIKDAKLFVSLQQKLRYATYNQFLNIHAHDI